MRVRPAMRGGLAGALLGGCLAAFPTAASGQPASPLSGPAIHLTRATGRIVIDGDLSDEAWRTATRIDQWYETNPGDNAEPKVRNVGYVTFDDKALYAAFEFEDPHPEQIRSPFTDRDNIGNGFNDYGGVLLDTRNSGHTGTFFVVTPHNIQYDSITDDASGEDPSPDFFWDSATKITAKGWTLEIRIPFSSLRYKTADPQTWGILLYRNYPRQFHYQFFSAKMPRGGNCFVCRANTLTGLERLPAGGHIVAAPYASLSQNAQPSGDLGTPLVNDLPKARVGVDVKWTPSADNAIDLTLRPDFSQVESDTAQISTNQRFALFFPEKRPFFLEGVELFSMPIQAVYTRTITSPDGGARLTGKSGHTTYTVLAAEDAGGGSVILPGPDDSTLAPQDFASTVVIARARHDLGRSFVSVLLTDRDNHDGNGHNLVVGPDFLWRPTAAEAVTGQFLVSDTRTPNRPDLSEAWTGQTLQSSASSLSWTRNTTHLDLSGVYKQIGRDFRADAGFLPQVDYREGYGGGGYTFFPTGFVSRLRTFVSYDRQVDLHGALISSDLQPGFGMDTRWNGFMQFRYMADQVRAGAQTFPRQQLGVIAQFSPSRRISQMSMDARFGQEIDFTNARAGRGTTLNLSATLDPTDHLELAAIENEQWLNVDDAGGAWRRLFVARVSRLRTTYTFTARSFLRTIVQYVATDSDPSLYRSPVPAASGTLSGSVLLAYKVNWQSVIFIGYGDDRELTDPNRRLAPADHQFFVKLSYAFQR